MAPSFVLIVMIGFFIYTYLLPLTICTIAFYFIIPCFFRIIKAKKRILEVSINQLKRDFSFYAVVV